MMQFRHLQHYILAILFICGFGLSIAFSAITVTLIKSQAVEESQKLTRNLINTVKANAETAVFSGEKLVGQVAIDGLLANDVIYSVELIGFADEVNLGMRLSGTNENGGSGLEAIVVGLASPFDDDALGLLSVQPSVKWIERTTKQSAASMILGLIVVIFSSCLVTAQLIKWKISKPLVEVVKKLQQIKPDSETRLCLPKHLKTNEIGALVGEFNNMLDRNKQAILVERDLRRDMESVQTSLEHAKWMAEQATEAKSNFLATMSHEIRTPMNSILGFIELALESPHLGKEARRHLEIANSSAKFLLQLINDILDVSKIESGKLELDIHAFDLNSLLDDVNDLMGIKAHQKSLALNLHRPDSLAPSYYGDPYRLRQIFINLVGNAIKFTEKGEVELNVKLVILDKEMAHFEFSVVDTGIGIAEDKIDQILKPFTQVDASISRQFGGTGLGTSIAAELVQLMGGELKIQSILGKGSRFYFEIQLEQSDEVLQIEQAKNLVGQAANAANAANEEPLQILLVDDVLENITLAKIRLEKAGHQISTAEDGLQAVELAAKQRFDVILMDIQMPNMNGYQATRLIRQQSQHNGHNHTIPIIALTANAMKDVQTQVMDAGMTEFVVKPIDFDDLFATIQAVIPNKVIKQQATTDHDPHTADYDDSAIKDIVNVEVAVNSWIEKEVYFNALQGFFERNQQTATEFQCIVNTQDKIRLDALTHKVKGAAGNLQLNHLYQHAMQLEEQLATLTTSLSPGLVAPIIQALDKTLSTIFSLLQISKITDTTDALDDNEKRCLAPDELIKCVDCIDNIVKGCEQHDPDMAENGLEQLGEYIDGHALADIDSKLQQFDFASTLKLITALKEDIQ